MNLSQQFVLFQTSNAFYLYDLNLKKILLLHPILYHILQFLQSNAGAQNVDKLFLALKKHPARSSLFPNLSKRDVRYHYARYLSLHDSGYFAGIDKEELLSRNIEPEEIKNVLANLKQVTFETCDRCNMNCHYCGYGDLYYGYDRRENKNLNLNYAKNLILYLIPFWNSPRNISHNKNITISFYGGEPLLNFPFIKEIVHFVRKLYLPHNIFAFSMTTNGILLEKFMDFLVENDFSLLISLDGDEHCNQYRLLKNNEPAFRYTFNNAKALQKKYPAYFKRKVNFNAVFHNKSSIDRVYTFFKENFDKIPSIADVSPNGINPEKKAEFLKTYADINRSLYHSEDCLQIEQDMFINLPTVKSVASFLQRHSGYVYDNYNTLLYRGRINKKFPTGTCFPFDKRIFLNVNGKILPCERIGHKHALGFVDEKKVSLDFDSIAQKYNSHFDKIRKQCIYCYNVDTCQQCIFHFESEFGKNVCKWFMGYDDFARYLSGHMEYIENNPVVYAKIMEEVTIE